MLKYIFKLAVLLCFVASTFVTQSLQAAKLVSYCAMDNKTKTIRGLRVDEKLPLASVSKLFTSLVATNSFSLEHKFMTQIFAREVGKQLYDVHIQGSPDPYFNRFKMHMIVSKLNEAGVRSIRNLTFDENVKYLHDTDSYAGFRVGKTIIKPLILKADLNFPSKDLVKAQLQQSAVIMRDYGKSFSTAKAAGIDLFKNPSFKVGKVAFKATQEFQENKNDIKIYVASQDLRTIIKSMNWNSNNFSANRLLVASGGLDRFHDFYTQVLKAPRTDLEFVNGSGQNHSLDGEGRIYNEATCNMVVRTVRALKQTVEKQKAKVQDVVAVMGKDLGSTVGGKAYSNSVTTGKVVAKTGTIGTHVTLAGMVHGSTDDHFFMYTVAVNGTTRDENRGRQIISRELQKLVKEVKGTEIEYIMDNPLKDSLENYDEDTINELTETPLQLPLAQKIESK